MKLTWEALIDVVAVLALPASTEVTVSLVTEKPLAMVVTKVCK